MIDTDEFLFPVQERSLPDLLKKYDDYASLSVNWKLFGSGDVEKIGQDKLLIESLLLSSGSKDLYVKTIVKPRYVQKVTDPHFADLKPGYFQVTENLDFFSGSLSPDPTQNLIRINHYWARDWDFFRSTKLARVHIVNRSSSEVEKEQQIENLKATNRNISTNYDDSIVKFVPELRRKMGLSYFNRPLEGYMD
jgi:hypothetical protein